MFPASRGRRAFIGAFSTLALSLGAAGCGDADPDAAPTPVPEAAPETALSYVGRAACEACHPAEVAAFTGSHHDLAMAAPTAEALRGDFDDARFGDAAKAVRFFRGDGAFHIEAPGRDGSPVAREVAWAFGTEPLQQLLVPDAGGRLQAFGVAWDARPVEAGGGRWFDLFPDAVPGGPLHWTGFEQTANHQCLECHTTDYAKGYDPADDTYTSRWHEEDVSCEACHGPASRHVAWARERGDGAEPDARGSGLVVTFAGPGSWAFAGEAPIAQRGGPSAASSLEVDTCARCHARRERFADGDRPDRPFLDAHRPALLDAHLYHADGQPRDEVYVWGSFLQSRMAAAGVTCSDCHEPHSLALREEGNTLCAGCHRPDVYDVPAHHRHAEGSEASRCVTCHMPTQVFMGVDARREHAFRVPRPDLADALEVPDVCTGCHAEHEPAWAARAIAAWHGDERPPAWRFPAALASARAVEPDAAPLLVALVQDASEPAIARATAVRELGGFLDASTAGAFEQALRDPDPLVRMAAAEAGAALPPPMRADWLGPLLDDPARAVRLAAARALAGVEMPSERDDARLSSALAAARAGARRNADRAEAHLELALLAGREGDLDAARREAERALAMDPDLVPAAVNLADVLRASGHDDVAESVLREALERTPESPALHHALGLLLVRRGERDAAREALARADELADDGSFAYALGLLLVEEGRAEDGLRVLDEALERRPGDRQLLVALATLHRDRGEREAALGYARRLVEAAPGDPGAAQLLTELRR